MLKAEEQMELAVLKEHGASIRGLSRSTGRSRNTVRRYLRGGDEVTVKRKPGPKRAEKLDPFKAYIVDRIKAALPDRIPDDRVISRDQRARLRRWRDAPEAVLARINAAVSRRTCGSLRDHARSSDAGGLGDGWAWRGQAIALDCDAWVEPPLAKRTNQN